MAEEDEVPVTGEIRDKLVRRKQDWAREGRLLTGAAGDPGRDRLPPGQKLVQDWPILDLGVEPHVSARNFRLDVDGLVRTKLRLDHAAFMALPQVDSQADMHCVTQWSRYDNRWQGVSAGELLRRAEVLPEARHVIFHAYDGYTTNVTLEQFDQPDVFLVHRWQGEPISGEHGGPVRVLIPRLYLWKSAKWIRRIELAAADRKGFWETRGYNNNADPWAEERYA